MATNSSQQRTYDIVLLGATGITGTYCAEHVATHLPTNLRWAVAGRSATKLQAVVDDIQRLNPDRPAPAVEVADLNDTELSSLARKTRVLVTCVGPYVLYGEPAMRACAESGTAYIDTTGETPWVADMIRKYHEQARQTGAILIPQCGYESAASDMLVYEGVQCLRNAGNVATGHVNGTVYKARMQATGGTIATMMAALDLYSLKDIQPRPFMLSTRPRQAPDTAPRDLLDRLSGTFLHPRFGPQGVWLMGGANAAIVERSWSLLGPIEGYGEDFTYRETLSSRSRLLSFAINTALGLGTLLLAISPIRWLARRVVLQPGQGPARESDAKSFVDLRAELAADGDADKRALSRLAWKGSVYRLTAVLMMEAALVLLKDDCKAKEFGGGILTPATLGDKYLERLRRGGVTIEANLL